MPAPRDIDVTKTPVWVLTAGGLPPFATPLGDQTLYFDYDEALAAKKNAGPHARLWKAVLTATTSLSKWEEA